MWFLNQQIYFFIFTLKSMANSCLCENKTVNNGIAQENILKRDLESDDYVSTETYNISKAKSSNLKVTPFKVYADGVKSKEPDDISEVCPHYKNTTSFDVDKMADVWQTAYFRMSEKVSCFKIYIRKTSEKERKRLSRKYGYISYDVNWDDCLLEIKSGESQYNFIRKHYLQVNRSNNGIFANVILEENENRGNLTYLHEENADQWLVIKNLLLMRDCENGDVAVFSRVPHQPRLEDLWDALKAFGEEAMNGTLTCLDDDRVQRSIKNVLQEVLFRFRLF